MRRSFKSISGYQVRGRTSISTLRLRRWRLWGTIRFHGKADLLPKAVAVMDRGPRPYRYLDPLINIFLVVLIVSNLIAPKFVAVGWLKFSAAQLLFPLTYIFGDVFTEVYGYSASRKAIWTGFMASAIMTAFGVFAIWLPPAPEFKDQAAYETIFGAIP